MSKRRQMIAIDRAFEAIAMRYIGWPVNEQTRDHIHADFTGWLVKMIRSEPAADPRIDQQ